MRHYPVMLSEVLMALAPKDGEVYLDGTFGNGGYSAAFLAEADCHVVALDQDPDVKSRASELVNSSGGRIEFIQTPFSKMDDVLGGRQVDAVVLDIGVSSMQIDEAERGFSFMRDGPLDMRMQRSGPSAADAVNQMPEEDLARIFSVYGEERRARRAARLISKARSGGVIATTQALADLLEQGLGRAGKIHPATRVFQALRIFINDELGELYRGLCSAEAILNPGGRLIVVTFHSLEDRIVKKFIRRRADMPSAGSRYMPVGGAVEFKPSFMEASRSVVKPSAKELVENVRSRSAKLRLAVRTENPAFDGCDKLLPNVPQLSDFTWAA